MEELEHMFAVGCRNLIQRDILLKRVLETDFLVKLIPLFHVFEDLENVQDCYRMATILRCLFFLNNHSLILKLFVDEIFPDVLGILECIYELM